MPGTTYTAIVGQVLARKRADRGLEQAVLAKSLGVGQSTWSRVENGAVALTVEQLRAVAAPLAISPDEVLREADHYESLLTSSGVKVIPQSEARRNEAVMAFLAGAALGALLVALLSRK